MKNSKGENNIIYLLGLSLNHNFKLLILKYLFVFSVL